MGNRRNATEQKGIAAVYEIMANKFEWIFREQPKEDFGIDAHIEVVDNENPTNNLIALQIKTGPSHYFTNNSNHLSYRTSMSHYNYWLSSNIPVIFVAHLPKTKETYWEYVTEKNFRKPGKTWILDIPKRRVLDSQTKQALIRIVNKHKTRRFAISKGKTRPDSIEDALVNIDLIPEATDCIANMDGIIKRFSQKQNQVRSKFDEFLKAEMSSVDPKVKAYIDSWGHHIKIASKRLETETEIFSELYSLGFSSYAHILEETTNINPAHDIKQHKSTVVEIEKSLSMFLESISSIKIVMASVPRHHKLLSEASNAMVDVLEMMEVEFENAKQTAHNFM